MPYMLLVVEQPNDRRSVTEAEARTRFDRMMAFGKDLSDRGLLIAGESLRDAGTGVRIRKRSGTRTMIDGPFAEAKEMIGGFFLIDCATWEEAVAIGDICPAAEWSTIEVRTIGPCYDDVA